MRKPACSNKHSGAALIVCLLLLACIASIMLAGAEQEQLHTRNLYNIAQAQHSLILAEQCMAEIETKLSQLPAFTLWTGNGLYNRQISGPLNLRRFNWTDDNSLTHSTDCRYIVEYLGLHRVNSASRISSYLLRVTVRLKNNRWQRSLQAIYAFKHVNGSNTKILTTRPFIQQWVELTGN